MGVRGRQSTASLSVVGFPGVERCERASAPHELTQEQAEEWRAVVDRMPAEWFPRETWGMLTQYCRHVVSARRVAQLIASAEDQAEISVDDLDKLYKMQEREGRAISSLSTRMRMTQQATYDKTKKKPMQSKRPWE
jgi:chaperone required for assembly of F1-ATPase